MKRRGRPNSSPNVALFPFLAVLMCTMGALVLMLVVIARNSREQAARESSFVAAPPLEDLEIERSTVAWRVEQLRSSREKTLAQLAEERAQLSHLEDHSRRLRDQLATELADAAMLAQTDQRDKQTIEQLRAELARTEVERKALAEEWENAKKAPRSTSESYAIVPYDGPNQTRRRPIYIECRADSLVLQPEGITLTEQDFLGAVGANNPLAAALRAAREYLGRNQRPGQIDAGEPYPLLLVRPGGIGAYYAARSAMTSWGADFGYELIEDSWELEFLPADAGLAETLARAVDESRRRQVALAMSAPRLLSASERSAYRTASARVAGGAGSGIGGGAGQGGFGSFLPARNTNQDAGSNGAPMRGTGVAGSGGGPSPYAGLLTGNSGGGAGAAGAAYPGTGPGGTGVSPYAGLGGNGTGSAATGGAGAMSGGPGVNGLGGYGQGGAGISGQPGGTAATGQPGGTGGAAGANSFAGGGSSAGGSSANSGSASGGAAGSAGGASAGGAGAGGGASPIGAPQTNASVQLGGDSKREQGPSPANQAAATPNGTLPKGNAFDTPGKSYSQPSASQNATSTAASTGAASSATVSGSSSGSGEPGAQPSVNLDATIPPSADAASLAKTRGKDWSLPESKMGAVPVTRPISIECRAERLVLKSERGDLISSQEIALGQRTADSMDSLVTQIRRRIDSWGIAGRGMYWRPILMVKVEKGGEQRFADLQELLHDSGLDVRKKAMATRIPPPALPLR